MSELELLRKIADKLDVIMITLSILTGIAVVVVFGRRDC
jgi:hypothetical protein